MSTRLTKVEHKMRYEIENYIDKNMPKIRSHGGEFAIYDINLEDKFVRIKFAGACTSCSKGSYKFDQLIKRIPIEFEEINNVYLDFV